jgi:hypothetical protein
MNFQRERKRSGRIGKREGSRGNKNWEIWREKEEVKGESGGKRKRKKAERKEDGVEWKRVSIWAVTLTMCRS